MCFACKLNWQQQRLWNPREQQGVQSHPRKASDCPRPGPSRLWPGPAATMSDVSSGSSKGQGWAYGPHLTLTTSEPFLWTWVWLLEESREDGGAAGGQ